MEHVVTWDAEAVVDFDALKSPKERKSVHTVVDLLSRTKTLAPPHAKKLQNEPGLFELRPRSGKSAVRPLYRRTEDGFVILAVSVLPDKADFDKAVRNARARFPRYDA